MMDNERGISVYLELELAYLENFDVTKQGIDKEYIENRKRDIYDCLNKANAKEELEQRVG